MESKNIEESTDFYIDKHNSNLLVAGSSDDDERDDSTVEVKTEPVEVPDSDIQTIGFKTVDLEMISNTDNIRKAPSEKSYGGDSASEYGMSDEDIGFEEDLVELAEELEDSDEEFDRLVKCTKKMIKKMNQSGPDKSEDGLKNKSKARKDDINHEYDVLPPIEKLSIKCNGLLSEIGVVSNVVDCIVTISATCGEVLDFDSYVFDQSGDPIGQIYDIFGQVKQPNYAVRFNSHEEAVKLPIGTKVYYAPNDSNFSKTPFKGLNLMEKSKEEISKINKQLDTDQKMEKILKGMDVSDIEFSDDESEKLFFKKLNLKKCNETRKRDKSGRNVNHRVHFQQPNKERQTWNWHDKGPKPFRRDFVTVKNNHESNSKPENPTTTEPAANPYAEFGCYNNFESRFGI